MKTLGSATVVNHTSVCESSKKVGMEPTWGPDIETPDFANAKYVLNFGSNVLEAAYFHNPLSQRVTEGRVDNQMKIVTFDVRLSNTAGFSDEWIPVFPATDGAVALAMGHVILREDLQDTDFINNWTNVTVEGTEGALQAVHAGVGREDFRRSGRDHRAHRPRIRHHQAGHAVHLPRPGQASLRLLQREGLHDAADHDRQRREEGRLLPAARHGLAAAEPEPAKPAKTVVSGRIRRTIRWPPTRSATWCRSGSPRASRRSTSTSPTRTTRSTPIPAPRRCGASCSRTRS